MESRPVHRHLTGDRRRTGSQLRQGNQSPDQDLLTQAHDQKRGRYRPQRRRHDGQRPHRQCLKSKLNTDKSEVIITILIEEKFKIRKGSFHIETAGFLEDKYIGIIPTRNHDAPMLPDGATVP